MILEDLVYSCLLLWYRLILCAFQVEECFIDKFAVVCTYVSSKRLCSKNYNSRDFDRGIDNHLACLCCENVLFHTETSFKLVFPVVSETGLFWSPFSVQHWLC